MPDKRPRFDDLFGRASHDVDYEAAAGEPILPMPEETDNLQRTVEKIDALAAVVASGKSLAVRTGFRGATRQERGQFVEGESELTGIELAEMHTARNAVAIAPGNLDRERAQLQSRVSMHPRRYCGPM